MRVDWQRGLERLWIAASGIWVAVWIGCLVFVFQPRRSELTDPVTLGIILLIAVAPPFLALALYYLGRWVWRGFRPADQAGGGPR